MAVNPNPDRQNNHVFVAAKTGGGKSQLVRNEILPVKNNQRVLLWDVDHDHKCQRHDNRKAFMQAVKAAVKRGGGFRIGWSGEDSQDTFIWFCEVAWAILDGQHETVIMCEEVADLELGQKTPSFLKKLLVRGRKYGARVVSTTQRCQEVPKLLITQPRTRFIGPHDDNDAHYLQRNLSIPAEEIEALNPLNFWRKDETGRHKVTTKYRKFTP